MSLPLPFVVVLWFFKMIFFKASLTEIFESADFFGFQLSQLFVILIKVAMLCL